MKLTIITINYNNASGLQKTMDSVFIQTSTDFEYIVVDGGSIDCSIEFIKQFDSIAVKPFSWISEPDKGIYNAMNIGIKLAKGDYLQFLNSGDSLVDKNVTERMLKDIPTDCNIFYGNMLKQVSNKNLRDKGFDGRMPTMIDFYTGTLNHSSAYLKSDLFKIYGLYDESLKIVSDWKWYLKVIAMNGIVPVYVNVDVSVFDMNGISTINSGLEREERRKVLIELFPVSILSDYNHFSIHMDQLSRINRYLLTRKVFWLAERFLFKFEKIFRNKNS